MTRGAAPVGAYFPGSQRRPIAHGTTGGYRAHFRYGEPMCEPCRQAERDRLGRSPRKPPPPCGTRNGYERHVRSLREKACEPCRRAKAAAQDAYKRALRGDHWPYEALVPAVAVLTADGLTPNQIAEQLGVSRLRVGRARARAERGAS